MVDTGKMYGIFIILFISTEWTVFYEMRVICEADELIAHFKLIFKENVSILCVCFIQN